MNWKRIRRWFRDDEFSREYEIQRVFPLIDAVKPTLCEFPDGSFGRVERISFNLNGMTDWHFTNGLVIKNIDHLPLEVGMQETGYSGDGDSKKSPYMGVECPNCGHGFKVVTKNLVPVAVAGNNVEYGDLLALMMGSGVVKINVTRDGRILAGWGGIGTAKSHSLRDSLEDYKLRYMTLRSRLMESPESAKSESRELRRAEHYGEVASAVKGGVSVKPEGEEKEEGEGGT